MKGIINDYICKEDASVYEAFWILNKNKKAVFIIDEDEKLIGLLTKNDFDKIHGESERKTASELCNKSGIVLHADEDNYSKARNIFAETSILSIPVVDSAGKLIDVFTRERAYYLQYYKADKLPRMHYAYNIYTAANEAKRLGLNKMSVIEFCVAGGTGLVNCEFHAGEIGKLLNLDIEIYGFDRGEGMPAENEGYKDLIHLWPAGAFKLDSEILTQRLKRSKLILGEMSITIPAFVENYNPAPIGTMLVDCDYYSSTKEVLKLLEFDHKYFLPRIYMYFDDVLPGYEFQGEGLAIKEFNSSHEDTKISPEYTTMDKRSVWSTKDKRIKVCHRFLHPLYNTNINNVALHQYTNEF